MSTYCDTFATTLERSTNTATNFARRCSSVGGTHFTIFTINVASRASCFRWVGDLCLESQIPPESRPILNVRFGTAGSRFCELIPKVLVHHGIRLLKSEHNVLAPVKRVAESIRPLHDHPGRTRFSGSHERATPTAISACYTLRWIRTWTNCAQILAFQPLSRRIAFPT